MTLVAKSSWRPSWTGRTSEYSISFSFSEINLADSYQGRITEQLCRLGGSYDWSRVAFTMNEVRPRNG